MLLLCSCLFGIFISHSGASVSLMIKDGVSSFQEGSEVVLICTISPYKNVMTWLVNNDPYADCFKGCGASSNKPFTFIFNFDESNGEFRLTIESVNTSHAGQLFSCDDGSGRKTITFNVTTRDQNNSSIMNTTSTTVNKPSESDGPSCDTLCIILLICIFGGIIALSGLSVLVIIILHCCVRPKFTNIELKDTKIHLEWADRLNCCRCCQCIFGYNIVPNPTQGPVKDKIDRDEFTNKKQYTLEYQSINPMAIYEISLSRKLCCFKSSAPPRSVITRKIGMPIDQEYHAKSTSIDVKWTKPDCISNPQLKYKVTCNEEVEKGVYDQTNITFKDLIPGNMYKIEVFAIDEGTDRLLLAKKIPAKPINVKLEVVGYEPGESSVKCRIKWTVENFDTPETLNASDNFLFNVLCRKEKEQIHKREKITDSRYTIPDLHPNRSYTVDVYAIYKSRPLESHGEIQLTPYIPAWDSEPTPKSTEIELKWKKPEYTGDQPLEYEVFCNREMVAKTPETSYTIENCKPRQKYDIEIFTIINKKNGMKSLPLQRTIRTQPVQPRGNHLPYNAVDAV